MLAGNSYSAVLVCTYEDVDGAITVGLSLLEPGIIIAMAVVVVGIVLSILLPILQLNTAALG